MALSRPAAAADLAWIAPAALASHAIAARGELDAIHASEPWRIRVTAEGDGALLERWRPGLDDLAIAGLWCPPRRVTALVADLASVARETGFTRLVAPIVHEEAAQAYLAAGMEVAERVDVMRVEGRALARAGAGAHPLPEGVAIRDADETDLEAIAGLDAACFDAFWHYAPGLLRRLSAGGRLAVATEGATVIGYTLSTLQGAQGSLGRIAVAPDLQRRGIGRALTADAAAWLARHGARTVVLSTQAGNKAARALYHRSGFTDVPGRLVVLATGRSHSSEECR